MILCGPSFCLHWVVCYCSCSSCAICCLFERWLTQCVIIIEYSHIIVIIYRSVAVSWTCIFIWQTCLIWHQNKYMFRTSHVFLDNIFGSIRKYLLFTFTHFTFMHLADAFIQSDLHCIKVTVSTFYQLLLSLGYHTWTLLLSTIYIYIYIYI